MASAASPRLVRGLSAWHPRRRRDSSTDSPRGSRGVAATCVFGSAATRRRQCGSSKGWEGSRGNADPTPDDPIRGSRAATLETPETQVGALVRTAAAAGADAVLLVGDQCADAFGPKALRASMGAAFRVPIALADSWTAAAPLLAGLDVLVADGGAGAVASDDVPSWGRACLVVGAETGLTADLTAALDALQATRVKIDIEPDVESLNAAVAGSFLLLDARRRRREDGGVS